MKTTIYTVTVRIPVRVVHKPTEPPAWVDKLMSALIWGLLGFAAGLVLYGVATL